MSDLEPGISQKVAPAVFTLTSHLYPQQEQSYFLSQLIEPGAEAKIQPAFSQQAVQQIQAQRSQAWEQRRWFKELWVGAGVAIASLSFLAFASLRGAGCHPTMSRIDSQANQSR